MDKAPRIQAAWRWPAFLGLHLLALALLASWIPEAGRQVWREAGTHFFLALHGTLGHNALWDALWALCSTRLWDILVGALMLALLLHHGWAFRGAESRRALFHVLALMLILVLLRTVFSKLVGYMHWQHASPSELIPGSYRLSDAFPGLERVFEVKDRSSRSFPGDHASVLFVWGLFMACFCRGWKLWASLALVLFCTLPRLMAGAHWLEDVAVGGVLLAALAFAWGYCTPLAGFVAAGLERCSQPLLPWLQRLPAVGRWGVLQRR
ncbi:MULTISPECIES: phosphatase PAP2 family protein [unclassified Pseudomonas]|uniref:phosphatase PAP2 family protein n=1 Tax=unclassified Pseudomonas TaxID=196821 RepID=UPI00244CA545|nr:MULTISPECIES: phosphatase PAP2 family protein [unclassified Pseudomonas]MDG9926460.1 phosphatase PAP2 family protein [Pseudomonas sp. GD04042]MDH0481456.1 phosphatase PAP2 family protein [Pseudomonas sp. GD04015]MDH0603404.1 phosphatase PAP2 family protein [Pseudomonas sp. GD03869]